MTITKLTITAAEGANGELTGSFDAYVAMPDGATTDSKHPAVIVIQEVFGVNENVRKKCDWLASQGYMAVAPDLFWRTEPGIDLDPRVEEQMQRGFTLLQSFEIDLAMEDLKATLLAVTTHHNCTGKVGTVGYCLGGRLAYLMATRSNTACNVSYYGVTIESYLNESNNIHTPLLMHIAADDKFVPPAAQQEITRGLSMNPHVTIHSYAGVDHAFTREGGDHYNAEAAKIADQRTLDFFKANLG